MEVILLLGVFLFICSVICGTTRIVQPNQRGVILRLGIKYRVIEPGLHFIIPMVDKVFIINLDEKVPGWKACSTEQVTETVKTKAEEEPHFLEWH